MRDANSDAYSVSSFVSSRPELDPVDSVSIHSYQTTAHKPFVEQKCDYCGSKNFRGLVQCCNDDCNRWFCNIGTVKGTRMSHIVAHLKESNHCKIMIDPRNHGIQHKIECGKCKCSNVFSLGYIKNTRALICRVPCFINQKLTPENFISVIEENRFTIKLFKMNYTEKKANKGKLHHFDYAKNSQISMQDVKMIEYELMDIQPVLNVVEETFRIRRIYEDIDQYINTFDNLLLMEEEACEIAEKKGVHTNVKLYVEKEDDRFNAYFFGLEIGCKFTDKDKIVVHMKVWRSEACLLNKTKDGKFIIKLEVPAPISGELSVTMFATDDLSVSERIRKRLTMKEQHRLDPDILSIVLGQQNEVRMEHVEDLEDYSVRGRLSLNKYQNQAVRNAMTYKFSIIQGPPGTGKTQTISAIVYHIEKLCRGNSDSSEDEPAVEEGKIVCEEFASVKKICKKSEIIKEEKVKESDKKIEIIECENEKEVKGNSKVSEIKEDGKKSEIKKNGKKSSIKKNGKKAVNQAENYESKYNKAAAAKYMNQMKEIINKIKASNNLSSLKYYEEKLMSYEKMINDINEDAKSQDILPNKKTKGSEKSINEVKILNDCFQLAKGIEENKISSDLPSEKKNGPKRFRSKREIESVGSNLPPKINLVAAKIYTKELSEIITKLENEPRKTQTTLSTLVYYRQKLSDYEKLITPDTVKPIVSPNPPLSTEKLITPDTVKPIVSPNPPLSTEKPLIKASISPVLSKSASSSDLSDSSLSYGPKDNILICAPSNIPVIELRQRLVKFSTKILQVFAASKEKDYPAEPNTLHYEVEQLLSTNQKYFELKLTLSELAKSNPNSKEYERVSSQIKQIETSAQYKIINSYNIFCCTCVTTLRFLFNKKLFQHVIIDESTQALEPENFCLSLKRGETCCASRRHKATRKHG
jgi:hypothetical protein